MSTKNLKKIFLLIIIMIHKILSYHEFGVSSISFKCRKNIKKEVALVAKTSFHICSQGANDIEPFFALTPGAVCQKSESGTAGFQMDW